MKGISIPSTMTSPAIGSTMLFLCLAMANTGAWARTHYVEKWGSDVTACTRISPCLTIQFAVNNASKNDKIVVGPGIYDENIVIHLNTDNQPLEGLKLESVAGRYATIIRAASVSNPVIFINQPKVQIGKKGKGFSLEGATDGEGIELNRSAAKHRCKIEGNRIRGNFLGLNLNGEKLQVRYNLIQNNAGHGIVCQLCDQALIRENQIIENNVGISLVTAESVTIERNVVSESNLSGIFSNNPTEIRSFKDNVVELTADGTGITIGNADRALFQGNISARNDGVGMWIRQATYNRAPSIRNNLSLGNSRTGLDLLDLSRVRVENNTAVQNSEAGINFLPAVSDATIRNNNTILNDSNGSSCGLRNASNNPLIYSKHFFGGGDVTCANFPLTGTSVTRPSPTKVNIARGL